MPAPQPTAPLGPRALLRRAWLAALLGAAAARAPAAVYQPDVAATGGAQSRLLLGQGKGAIVGILDAGVDVYHPALRGSVLAQKDFTGENTADDTEPGGGHATGIAGVLVGHDTGYYTGYAPQAAFLNARVVNRLDVTNDRHVGDGLFWALDNGARVINLSLGETAKRPTQNKLNLMIDYGVERYGASFVGAVPNADASAVNDSPGGAYNGISVGALAADLYRQVVLKSATAQAGDLRTKPDLVAPGQAVSLAASDWETETRYLSGDGTSFAAPMVGGVLAQMIGYGKAHKLSTSPLVLKAVLMSSAAKVYGYLGTPWSPRDSFTDPGAGTRIDQPLDAEQGAGRLDAVAAYHLYARAPDASTPVTQWSLGRLARHSQTSMDLGVLKSGQRVDATLTWLRHVGWVDSNNNTLVDGADAFAPAGDLSTFTVELLRDGMTIATSESDVDNVQHLSWLLAAGGRYSLRVFRFSAGPKFDSFGLAARVLSRPPTLLPLRTNADGGPGAGLTPAIRIAPNYAPDFQTNFERGGAVRGAGTSGAAAIPEPASTAFVTLTLFAGTQLFRSARRTKR